VVILRIEFMLYEDFVTENKHLCTDYVYFALSVTWIENTTFVLEKLKRMSLTRILPTFSLIIALAAPAVVSAQVPVEVSTEKVVSGGRVYYMHEVQKNQTLYSIAKAYRVTVDALTRENVIPPNGIQTGQMLKVPASDQQLAATSQPRPASQQAPAATRPRPSAQPSGSVPVSGVPGISISNERIVTGGKTFFMHEVQKGQTLYSIAKAYRVTILDIDRENSIPPGGIQAGQMLKIPASSALTFTQVQNPPDQPAAVPDRNTAAAARGNTASGTAVPRQETARQETQMPRQETPRQETQMPRQEQPTAKQETAKPVADGAVTFKTADTAAKTEVKTQPGTKTQPEAAKQPQAQQETPSAGRSEDKPKPVQPEKKKIHKVQKGESLADIAKKYGVTVQELKAANKGVIFAMPDMRLVIPVKDDE
jgi:LysM repeat protein